MVRGAGVVTIESSTLMLLESGRFVEIHRLRAFDSTIQVVTLDGQWQVSRHEVRLKSVDGTYEHDLAVGTSGSLTTTSRSLFPALDTADKDLRVYVYDRVS